MTTNYKLTESKLNLYKKEIHKQSLRIAGLHPTRPPARRQSSKKNQILTVLEELNRFSNNINGIPNGVVMAPLPAPKVEIKTLEIA